MKRAWIALVLIVGGTAICAVVDDLSLVLVASDQSAIRALTPVETRRVYLGVPIIVNGQEIVPLRNRSSSVVDETFLQKVMFMSADAYERQMIGRVFRNGGNRIREFTDARQLVATLLANPDTVTYVKPDVAATTPGIRVVSQLWRE